MNNYLYWYFAIFLVCTLKVESNELRYRRISEILSEIETLVKEKLTGKTFDVVDLERRDREKSNYICATGTKLAGAHTFETDYDQNDDSVNVEIVGHYSFTELFTYFHELKVIKTPINWCKTHKGATHSMMPAPVDLVLTYTHDDSKDDPVTNCRVKLGSGFANPRQEVKMAYLYHSRFTMSTRVRPIEKLIGLVRKIKFPGEDLKVSLYLLLNDHVRELETALLRGLDDVFADAVGQVKNCVYEKTNFDDSYIEEKSERFQKYCMKKEQRGHAEELDDDDVNQ